MLRKVIALAALGLAFTAAPALAASGAKHPHQLAWSFEGPLGKFDKAQLQRGYKVYREVCAACHGMTLMSFRNLGQKGGPFYEERYPNPNDNPYVKALAAASLGNGDGKRSAEVAGRWIVSPVSESMSLTWMSAASAFT